jgi:hypothetical protein
LVAKLRNPLLHESSVGEVVPIHDSAQYVAGPNLGQLP